MNDVVLPAPGRGAPRHLMDEIERCGGAPHSGSMRRSHPSNAEWGRAVWSGAVARSTTAWIKDSKCNCSYECAWGFNILGNIRYQPKLIAAALKR